MNSSAVRTVLIILTILVIPFLSPSKIQAQSTPIAVQPTGYAVWANGKKVELALYSIHKSPYCKLEELSTVLSGLFDVKVQAGKNFYGADFPIYLVTTGKTQSAMPSKGSGPDKKAICKYAHLYVDGIQRPTTPYEIDNDTYFKLADILRILDIELIIDDARKSIAINTQAPFKLLTAKAVANSNTPKKWKKIPANLGMAVSLLNSTIDVNSATLLFNDQSNTDQTPLAGLTLVDIPTGRKLVVPFDEKENSYDNVNRGFSEGWVQVLTTTGQGRFLTYINSNGEVINPKRLFTSARGFENGKALVTYMEDGADYTGVIDHNGEVILAVAGKYENAQLSNGVFGFQYFLKRNHNVFYDDHYYNINGKRLDISKERAKEFLSPGYNKEEVEKFEPHRSKYGKSLYCGYNRFLVESNAQAVVVDKDNKTIFSFDVPMHNIHPIFAWGKLFFNTDGIVDQNGKQILERKYSIIEAVDGEAFLTIIDNRAQTLVGLDGKVIASSANAPLKALKKGVLVTLRNYNLKSEIISGDVVMIHSGMNLETTLSTSRLKTLVAAKPYADRWLLPTHTEAQKIVQSPTANALIVIALEGIYNTRFSNENIQ